MGEFFHIIFYQPILNLLVFFYNIVPGNDLGLAIIFLTLTIKVLLYPLSKQAIKSQKALQDLQPKISELRKKHGKDREALGRATLALYRENKVNPLSSCLPLLVQLPFLFAVFRLFRNGFTNGALEHVYSFISRPEAIDSLAFFGFFDLSKPSPILAVLAGLAQYWQAKMLMAKRPAVKDPGAKDENMMAIMNKQMLYFMPALTIFIGLTFPGGLALYWFATTVLTGIQQIITFRQDKNKNRPDSSQSPAREGEAVK